MNEDKIQKALKEFCRNPYWKEYYKNAPTESCKRYIELKFYYSEYLGQIPDYSEFKKTCDEIEEKFIKVDWMYLYKHSVNNPKKAYYKKKIESCL